MDFKVNWTLFLDRDGVINERLPGKYVKDWVDFKFRPEALGAIKALASIFSTIIIVTNQQGIGKGLMEKEDLDVIHQQMLAEITTTGGRIDAIYYCPDLAVKIENCRKPNPQMAFQAQEEFPNINFSKSIMVGDSISDMEFGRNLGMTTVLIESKKEAIAKLDVNPQLLHLIDFRFKNLLGLVDLLSESYLLY